MILTKAKIKSTYKINSESYYYSVYIPLLRKANDSEEDATLDATRISISGIFDDLKVGDIVYVGFEDTKFHKPVIFGKLFHPENFKDSISTSEFLRSLTVTDNVSLSTNTTIGDISYDDLAKIIRQVDNKQDSIIFNPDIPEGITPIDLNSIQTNNNYYRIAGGSGNYVDLTSPQRVGGAKTFTSTIYSDLSDISLVGKQDRVGMRAYMSGTTTNAGQILITTDGTVSGSYRLSIQAYNKTKSTALGTTTYNTLRVGDTEGLTYKLGSTTLFHVSNDSIGQLAGLTDGNNADYSLLLPNTTSWTTNKTIATTSDLSNYVNLDNNQTIDGQKDFKIAPRVKTAGEQPREGLPDTYTQLQYVESDGSQYIDTTFTINTSTDTVELVFELLGTTLYKWLFGEHDTNARFGLGVGDGTNKRNVAYGTTTYKASDSLFYNQLHYFKADSSGVYIDNTKIANYSSFSSTSTLALFCLNNSGFGNGISARIQSYKHTRNNVALIDLVPVIRNSDDKAGFYDFATNTFIVSNSSSDLIVGPEIATEVYEPLLTSNSLANVALTGDYGDLINKPTIPTSYVSSVNGSTGAITNVAKTNSDNNFSVSQTFSANSTTPIVIKSNGSAGYIEFRDNSNTLLGYYGVNSSKKPIFYDTSAHELAYKSDIGVIHEKVTLTLDDPYNFKEGSGKIIIASMQGISSNWDFNLECNGDTIVSNIIYAEIIVSDLDPIGLLWIDYSGNYNFDAIANSYDTLDTWQITTQVGFGYLSVDYIGSFS